MEGLEPKVNALRVLALNIVPFIAAPVAQLILRIFVPACRLSRCAWPRIADGQGLRNLPVKATSAYLDGSRASQACLAMRATKNDRSYTSAHTPYEPCGIDAMTEPSCAEQGSTDILTSLHHLKREDIRWTICARSVATDEIAVSVLRALVDEFPCSTERGLGGCGSSGSKK